MSDKGFEGSPEYEDWIESGGRDEELSEYYNKWSNRVDREILKEKERRNK